MGRHERFLLVREQEAQDVLERIRADAAAAPWPYQGLLRELAKGLFDPELRIGRVWQRLRQKDHSLSSRFQRRFGKTPKEYLEARRIEVAANLLLHPGPNRATIEEIARLVGYSGERVFQRAFLRVVGVSAGAWRREGPSPATEATPLPKTRLAALSEAQLEARLAEKVAQLAPGLPFKGWLDLIDGKVEFSTPALFEQLLSLSRELGRRDRQAGIKLAEKAVASLRHLRGKLPEPELAALEARGWAWVGNARRLAYDFCAAEEAFAKARSRLPRVTSSDVEGEVIYLEVGMQIAQYRLEEALERTEYLLGLYRKSGATKQLAAALLDHAEIRQLRGEAAAAVASLEEVSLLVNARCEPHLALAAFYTQALIQTRAGFPEKARLLLPAIQDLGRSVADPHTSALVSWLEGLILAAEGQADKAAHALRQTRQELATAGDVGNEALVVLDLAETELTRGQTLEAAGLAAEALAVLERIDVAHEAAGALLLLRRALETEGPLASTLGEIRRQIDRVCRQKERVAGDCRG